MKDSDVSVIFCGENLDNEIHVTFTATMSYICSWF